MCRFVATQLEKVPEFVPTADGSFVELPTIRDDGLPRCFLRCEQPWTAVPVSTRAKVLEALWARNVPPGTTHLDRMSAVLQAREPHLGSFIGDRR